MTEVAIKKYYLRFGVLNLILSLLSILFSREESLIGRFQFMILINLLYHILFAFFAFISIMSLPFKNDFEKYAVTTIIWFFMIFGSIITIVMCILLLHNAFQIGDYDICFGLIVPLGFFLGIHLSWVRVKRYLE